MGEAPQLQLSCMSHVAQRRRDMSAAQPHAVHRNKAHGARMNYLFTYNMLIEGENESGMQSMVWSSGLSDMDMDTTAIHAPSCSPHLLHTTSFAPLPVSDEYI